MGSLGETLAEERRRRGRTVADVEAATRIRGRLLEALENGRYDELPSSAYVKGYIQSYAQYLELPVRPLLEMYASEMRLTPEAHMEERPLDIPADSVVPARAQAAEMPLKTWATIVGVLLVGGLTVWGVVSFMARPKATPVPAAPLTATETVDETEEPTKPANEVPAVPSTEATSPATEPTTSTTPAEGTEDEKPVSAEFTLRVSVEDGEASWLRITVDGLKAYEGTLSGGETKEYRVSKDAKLRIGRPSAVTVTRDGTPVEIADNGDIGSVELSASDE